MDTASHVPSPAAIAEDLLRDLDAGSLVAPLTGRMEFAIPEAYRVAAALRLARESRGGRHAGRKIGFSNRTIWPIYGIDAPIWGDMYDETVREVAPGAEVALGRLPEPRIEPEIAFGLARPPAPGMDDAALLACCAWLAHGIEIVHSPYPGWSFRTADAIAAGGLHGLLLLGPRREAGPEWLEPLGDFSCRLMRDGAVAAEGTGRNVLDGPLKALRHLAEVLAQNPDSPPLTAGEIVTTGTLTDALPVAPGERWTTALEGIDLPGIDIRFV